MNVGLLVKLVFYCFATPAPFFLCSAFEILQPILFHRKYPHLTIVHRPLPFAVCAGRSIFLLFCSLPISFSNLSAESAFSLINMAPKRKATDAGSSSSPLKKRNAVTAGIGRAVESESTGVGFSYYGRTDDREDVSKTFLHPCSHHALFRSPN